MTSELSSCGQSDKNAAENNVAAESSKEFTLGVKKWDSYLLCEDTDIAFEQELQRDPYQIKVWLAYLKSKLKSHTRTRYVIYERALRGLPGSYKLWKLYLTERVQACSLYCPVKDVDIYEETNICFERSLVHLSRMPVIWFMYTDFLRAQQYITRTRRAFDRALRSIAITQHEELWKRYISFVKDTGVVEMAVVVFRRFVMLQPEHSDELVDFLKSDGICRYDEAACLLAALVNDEGYVASSGKPKHRLWLDLCNLITEHPDQIKSLRSEDVLRSGILRFSDEVGSLWTSLSAHYIRLGLTEKARDIYEEAVNSVSTLRDLAMVYDTYASFEEASVAAKLKEENVDSEELDFLISRLEYLTERRPVLISSCKLRQNPHNVNEWLARLELYKDNPEKVAYTFTEAVATIDPVIATGRLCVLWIAFARFYELHGDFINSNAVYEKSVKVNFRTVNDLACMWCEWIEMNLRNGNYREALQLARACILKPKGSNVNKVQQRLFRSVKLWALVADVEEMFGTIETVRATYEKMFQLKVITPQLVINFAHYLEEHHYYEESFRVYERGVAAFYWPHVNDLWLMYLSKFVSRYGSSKLERARELFQQATANIPAKFAKNIFLLYAKLEEEFGLAKHALTIYQAATNAVPPNEKADMYYIFIDRTSELLGIARTRSIFDEAIETLPDIHVRDICMRYASVEKSLGEIDRSRAIYQHASKLCDPNRDQQFWNTWRDFEVAHGNEETFKDMLRIKRSVMAQYSQVHHNVAELTAGETFTALPADPVQAAVKALEEEELMKRQMMQQEQAISERIIFEKKRDLGRQEIEEAQEEYRKIRQSRLVSSMLEDLPKNSSYFIPSNRFEGKRPGYFYGSGYHGLGYYLDEQTVGVEFLEERKLDFVRQSRVTDRDISAKKVRLQEEMDVEVDDVKIETIEIPEGVFGSLRKT